MRGQAGYRYPPGEQLTIQAAPSGASLQTQQTQKANKLHEASAMSSSSHDTNATARRCKHFLPSLLQMNAFSVRLRAAPRISALSSRRVFRSYSSQQTSRSASDTPKQSTHRPGGLGERLPIVPFVLILATTSGLYMLMVKQRVNQTQASNQDSAPQSTTARYRRNA